MIDQINQINKDIKDEHNGDIIIQQDQVADEFFILRRGLLVAVHRENFESVDYDLNVAKLVPGDIFGERSIVDPMNGRYRFSINVKPGLRSWF